MSETDSRKYVIIPAGGSGRRMGLNIPKQFLRINGKMVITHTIESFANAVPEAEIIVALPSLDSELWEDAKSESEAVRRVKTVVGGETRFHSVKSALFSIPFDVEGLVAVHDAARPLVSCDLITRVFSAAKEHGAVVPAVRCVDSVRTVNEDGTNVPYDRAVLRMVQTPQTFDLTLLRQAYNTEYNQGFTDDASVIESIGKKIFIVEGERRNIKITEPDDLLLAQAFMK